MRPCAARTRLFGLKATPNGALRFPSHPSQLRCFLIDPQKYILPRPSQLRWSFQQYFWGHNYVPVRPNFLVFSFFNSFWIFSFCYSLLFFSPFQLLLILLFFSLLILLVSIILRLPNLLFLYCILTVVLQTRTLMIYTFPSFWWVFRGGQAFFDPFGAKLVYIPVRPWS